MGCDSCKNKAAGDSLKVFINGDKSTREARPKDIGFQIFNITIRLFMFGVGLLLTPAILLFVVYLLFKTIVLNKGQVNLMPPLLKLASGLGIGRKKSKEEEHPEDYEDLDPDNPDDYELDEKVDKIEL
jgi:hypothetical protein